MKLTERYILEVKNRVRLAAEVTFSAEIVENFCADWLEMHEALEKKDARIKELDWLDPHALLDAKDAELAPLRKVAEAARDVLRDYQGLIGRQGAAEPIGALLHRRELGAALDALKGGKE